MFVGDAVIGDVLGSFVTGEGVTMAATGSGVGDVLTGNKVGDGVLALIGSFVGDEVVVFSTLKKTADTGPA